MVFHSTVLFVANIDHSKDFYTGLLNFSVEYDFGKSILLNNGLSLWEIQPGHTISQHLETKNTSNRFELYFETENIDVVSEAIHNAGLKLLHSLHEESWGQRTIRFFDPDDHLIEIGESLHVFINRLNTRGLTTKQIAEKSGIPFETVLNLLSR